MDSENKTLCPDCGGVLEPCETVESGQRRSRWWRCSQAGCRAAWLLPVDQGSHETILLELESLPWVDAVK